MLSALLRCSVHHSFHHWTIASLFIRSEAADRTLVQLNSTQRLFHTKNAKK